MKTDTVVELFYSGAWQDITDYVKTAASIEISRGRPNEAGEIDPTELTLTLKNRDGRFSAAHPASPLYGLIGRNTPIRVKLGSDVRATCEVPKWPTWWDPSGAVVDTRITAAGILRRLGQGSSPLRSAPYRAIMASSPAAYWPIDDGKESTTAAPAVGRDRLRRWLGSIEFAQSQPGPWLEHLARLNDSNLVGNPDTSGLTGELGVGVLFAAGDDPDPAVGVYTRDTGGDLNQGLFVQSATQIASYWTFLPDSGGATGADFFYTMPADFLDGRPHWWELRLENSGSDITHAVYVDGVALTRVSGTGVVPSHTLRWAFEAFVTGGGSGGAGDMAGHLAVWDDLASMDGIAAAALGHPGERAGRRIERLCDEEGVTFAGVGDLDETTALGPQYAGEFLEVLRHCEQADGGILFEPRDAIGLTYRTRVDLYNQAAALELDYADNVFGSAPEPVEDDRTIRNDVTIKRPDGSAARAVRTSGPLSTQAPPAGVGTYETSLEVHAASDAMLPALASWVLALGTVDEPRYPALHLNMAAAAFTSDAVLAAAAAGVDVGDLLTVDGMPAWLPPGLVRVLAQGFVETIGNNEHHIEINASPAAPFSVAEYEAAAGGTYRYDTAGSSLAAEFDAGVDTSMSVDVDTGQLWTTVAGEFPFEIEVAGVILEVTNITGASSPQTFTITQAPVNGVSKTIPAGAAVALAFKARYAL